MLIIHTALACEAKPWIEALNLKPSKGHGSIRLYQSDDTQLLVSGTGSLRTSASIAYALGSLTGQVDRSTLQAINIGVAGCVDTNIPIGDCFIVGKCSSDEGKRHLYPDIFFNHNLPLATLRTSDRIVHSQPAGPIPSAENPLLWDMEGYGFFSACTLFLSPSCMQSLKIVGDHLEDAENVTPKAIEDLMADKIETLLPTIEKYRNQGGVEQKERVLEENDLRWIDHCSKDMLLTATQKAQLVRSLRNWRTKEKLAQLDQILPIPPPGDIKHKREQRKVFAELLEKINQ